MPADALELAFASREPACLHGLADALGVDEFRSRQALCQHGVGDLNVGEQLRQQV